MSGYIFATKACIDNRKKLVKQQYLLHMSSQYGKLRPTSDWDLLASLGHPIKFKRVSRLSSVTARHSTSGRQPNFAALNRRCHLYAAGWPSRWALAHILVFSKLYFCLFNYLIINFAVRQASSKQRVLVCVMWWQGSNDWRWCHYHHHGECSDIVHRLHRSVYQTYTVEKQVNTGNRTVRPFK